MKKPNLGGLPMKDRQSKAEAANIKINQILKGENDNESIDVDSLINNNNISLVIKEQDSEDKF
jgi:hypothetical protein